MDIPKNNIKPKSNQLKAGALICSNCCVEFIEIEFDLEYDGTILHNVQAIKCPKCLDEIFTPEQSKILEKRINSISEC